MKIIYKIIIGTANLDKKYGFKNKKFKDIQNLKKIIFMFKKLSKNKVFFDTAQAYGKAEKMLGKQLKNNTNAKVISKISFKKKEFLNYKIIKKKVLRSINNLQVSKLYCLMLHNVEVLADSKNLKILNKSLERLKKENLIIKKGISIYDASEIQNFYKTFDPDVVQLPLNVFDQRFLNNGWIEKMSRDKKEIHLRSIFLQGLLLNKNPTKGFPKFSKDFKKWLAWLKKNKQTNYDACLNFVLNQKFKFRLIIGLDNYSQFNQLIKFNKITKDLNFSELACNKKTLIDPRKWN